MIWAAPFHFFHHKFVVGKHDDAKALNLVSGQPRDESGKDRVQRGDAFREIEFVLKEAFYDLVGFSLVNFHPWSIRLSPHDAGDFFRAIWHYGSGRTHGSEALASFRGPVAGSANAPLSSLVRSGMIHRPSFPLVRDLSLEFERTSCRRQQLLRLP